MNTEVWRWLLGLIYIVAVATIWVAAGFVVQSVVDGGVSPFLVTYVCNALLMIYIPVVEVWHYLEDSVECTWFWSSNKNVIHAGRSDKEEVLLGQSSLTRKGDDLNPSEFVEHGEMSEELVSNNHLDAKGRWTRTKTARVSLLLCPFWFLSYLCSNLSLKYTSVTSNTVLNSTSSLFTFLLSLIFLGERFTLLKLVSILLCFGGTVIVSLGDMESELSVIDTKPLLGDILALASACLYASFITIIRKRIPDEDEKCGRKSVPKAPDGISRFCFAESLQLEVHLSSRHKQYRPLAP
ncbi:hypothetical protein IFM89_026235 [Coptis chinensis]|uniref:EamA domain-containing protein n=1 Tax=Coptis chinensis TaxID=261450 RepID=A0A835I3K0_9MAGN|nr:hypothetical protein IFM89_026235 [Coptis chinensis]